MAEASSRGAQLLFQVGFAEGEDLLLTHAPQERRVYSPVRAERLAFDDEKSMDTVDTVRLRPPASAYSAGRLSLLRRERLSGRPGR